MVGGTGQWGGMERGGGQDRGPGQSSVLRELPPFSAA